MGIYDIARAGRPAPSRKIKDAKALKWLKYAQKGLSMWESKAQALREETATLIDTFENAINVLEDKLRDQEALDDDELEEMRDMLDVLKDIRDAAGEFRR